MVILNDQGGNVMSFSDSVVSTLRAESHQHEPVVCLRIQEKRNHEISDGVKCMTSWDYQGKRIYQTDGVYPTLYAAAHSGQQTHGVCYGISRSALKGGEGSTGGMPVGENVQPTITANGCGAVVYAVENHPMDCRVTMDDSGVIQTLSARMGTGGNNVPFVLLKIERKDRK